MIHKSHCRLNIIFWLLSKHGEKISWIQMNTKSANNTSQWEMANRKDVDGRIFDVEKRSISTPCRFVGQTEGDSTQKSTGYRYKRLGYRYKRLGYRYKRLIGFFAGVNKVCFSNITTKRRLYSWTVVSNGGPLTCCDPWGCILFRWEKQFPELANALGQKGITTKRSPYS